MSAKDTVRRNKTRLLTILSGDRMLILTKVHENNLITDREYKNLKSIEKEVTEGHVINLVDTLMNKGEESCKAFLNLLQTDEDIKATYPELKNMDLNYNILPTPVQAFSVNDVPPPESKTTKEADYYALIHKPRGLCVVFNNEHFQETRLTNRRGTQQDEEALRSVFTDLGFTVLVHNNLTAEAMRRELQKLGSRDFRDEDALVVCVLSHGKLECVYGTDEQKVSLKQLTQPFISSGAPTLALKPKLFFIQACQGSGYQGGAVPGPPKPRQEEVVGESPMEEDSCAVNSETVPWDADFLLGMATVPECVSFRRPSTGSIYIQELCKQLRRSAESSEKDDILTVLTRVNREVGKGEYSNYKQIPQPKYTLTKKLVLKYV